jgi:hypothetical protein
MPKSVRLAGAGGKVYDYTPTGNFLYAERGAAPRSRLAYAAVHVVADPLADVSPIGHAAIDWRQRLPFAVTSGATALRWQKPWTPHSEEWASTGKPAKS